MQKEQDNKDVEQAAAEQAAAEQAAAEQAAAEQAAAEQAAAEQLACPLDLPLGDIYSAETQYSVRMMDKPVCCILLCVKCYLHI